MEIIKCYNCGSIESSFYIAENGFDMVKCNNCGLLYVKNRPDEKEIMDGTKKGLIKGKKILDVTAHFNAGIIPQYTIILMELFENGFGKIQTWLDVGCGHGEFMKTIQAVSNKKISILGLEPNFKKQESAIKRGLDVRNFDIESHSEKYDMISMLDVYSHLPNPVEFIKKLRSLLNPMGEFLLETGDAANFTASEQVKPLCLPDHLSFASESIVVSILERLDFEIITIKKYPYLQLNFKSVIKEIVKLFVPRYNSNIKYYFNWKKHSKTNMFIRARLKS